MRSRYINIFLLFFACITLFLLIRYTNVVNIGISQSINEGIANLRRIMYDRSPKTELSNVEKEELKKTLKEEIQTTELFCQSTYFPFISGAKWRYQIASGTEKNIIEIGIPGTDKNSIFLDGRLMSWKNWTARTILECADKRIKATDLNFLTIFRQDGLVTTPCEAGQLNFSLPRDIDLIKGNSWSQSGCLIHTKLDQDYDSEETETKENLTARFQALGSETMNVPAGEFMTEKVELTLPNSLINFWIAPRVGIIKISEGATIQELVEYQIPTEKENKYKN